MHWDAQLDSCEIEINALAYSNDIGEFPTNRKPLAVLVLSQTQIMMALFVQSKEKTKGEIPSVNNRASKRARATGCTTCCKQSFRAATWEDARRNASGWTLLQSTSFLQSIGHRSENQTTCATNFKLTYCKRGYASGPRSARPGGGSGGGGLLELHMIDPYGNVGIPCILLCSACECHSLISLLVHSAAA